MILGSIIQASFILEYHLHLLIQTLLEELCVVPQLLYMLLVLLYIFCQSSVLCVLLLYRRTVERVRVPPHRRH